MYFAALLFNILLGTVIAKSTDFSKKTQGVTEHHAVRYSFTHKSLPAASAMGRRHKTLPKNMTYIDTPDNSMHVPIPAEDTTPNRKKPKKTPKRTIQKIIKKGRAKRKFYVKKNVPSMTSTSLPMTMQESEEVFSQRIDTPTTKPHIHKKKGKRWNDRTYQIPLHKLSPKKEQKRTKRALDKGRDNTYILQDFDEIEFLSKEKGVDVANVHVKNYW